MDKALLFNRIKTMIMIRAAIMAVSIVVLIVAMYSLFDAPILSRGTNSVDTVGPFLSIGVVGLICQLITIGTLVVIMLALNSWKQIEKEANRVNVQLLFISAILGIAGYVIALVGAGGLQIILMLVAYILDTIAYSQLKNSAEMTEMERTGAKKLFWSQMWLLIGVVVVIVTSVVLFALGSHMALDAPVSPGAAYFAAKTMMICVSIIYFAIVGGYFYFQIKGWNILAKAQSEEKTHVER